MVKSLHLKSFAFTLLALFGSVVAWADDTVLLDVDFTALSSAPSGWTAIDKSEKTGTTWSYSQYGYSDSQSYAYYPCIRLGRDWSSTHNDYYVSPALELKGGVTYKIVTLTGTSYNTAAQCVEMTLEAGTSQTDVSTFETLASLEPVGYTNSKTKAEQADTTEFTPDADGTFYFAFHGVESDSRYYGFILGMKVYTSDGESGGGTVTPDPEPQPVSSTLLDADFTTEPTDWTALDASEKAGTTWNWKSSCLYDKNTYGYHSAVRILHDWDSQHNDYYISPALDLKAGVQYTATAKTVKNNNPILTLDLGTSTTDASTFSTLATLNPAADYTAIADDSVKFTVETDGTYHLAFHIVENTESGTYDGAYLVGLKVESDEEVTPGPGPDPTPEPTPDGTAVVEDGYVATGEGFTWNADIDWDKQYVEAKILVNTCTSATENILSFGSETDQWTPSGDDSEVVHVYYKKGDKQITVYTAAKGTDRYAQDKGYTATSDTVSILVSKEAGFIVNGDTAVAPAGIDKILAMTNVEFSDKEGASSQRSHATYEYVHVIDLDIPEPEPEPEPVIPHEPGDTIIAGDFTAADAADGYTLIDGNADGHSWTTIDGISGLTYDSDEAAVAADEWIITPAVKLQSGVDYKITWQFAQQGAFDPDSIDVCIGSAATVEALSTVLAHEYVDADHTGSSLRYSCAEDGDKYIAFHVKTPNAENGQLSLLALDVTCIEKATPKAVSDYTASIDSETKTVKLVWTTPTEDTDGLAIVNPVGAKLYENGTLIDTFDDLTAGEIVEYEYTPASFAGKAEYSVVAFIGDNESAAVSQTVNLDDVTGTEKLVKQYIVNNSTKNDWTIIDANSVDGTTTGAWSYDYSDIFYFKYKMGTTIEDDWLISPSVALQTGKRYILKYQLKTARDYEASVDVTIGTAPTAEAQTTIVASHPSLKQNGFGDFATEQFSVDEDADYNIGFHVTDAQYYLSMRGLCVYSIENTATGIHDASDVQNVVAYSQAAKVLLVPAASAVSVYTVGGALVEAIAASGTTVDFSALADGIYVVKVTEADGSVHKLKIVK